MNTKTTECYGKMFPDLLKLEINEPNRAAVATVFLESVGIGIQGKKLTIDKAQWVQCVECPDFDHCYKLSLAKALLQHVVSRFA